MNHTEVNTKMDGSQLNKKIAQTFLHWCWKKMSFASVVEVVCILMIVTVYNILFHFTVD